jgi:hypothetical protein
MLEVHLPGDGGLSGGAEIMKDVEKTMRSRVAEVQKAKDGDANPKNTFADALLLPLAEVIVAA